MDEWTFNDVKKIFIICLIYTVIYMFVYKEKGIDKTLKGYMKAFMHCMIVSGAGMFFLIGIDFVKEIISEPAELMVKVISFVPCLGFFLAPVVCIKSFIEEDFEVYIELFKIDGQKSLIIVITFFLFLATYALKPMIFDVLFPDSNIKDNLFIRTIIVIGFLAFVVFIIKLLYELLLGNDVKEYGKYFLIGMIIFFTAIIGNLVISEFLSVI